MQLLKLNNLSPPFDPYPVTTGVVSTQRIRTQNHLLSLAKAFPFPVIEYNILTGAAEHPSGEYVFPASVLANETACSFEADTEYKRELRYICKRTFEMSLGFYQEIDPQSFIESILLSPTILQADADNDLKRTFISLKNTKVAHSPTQAATQGTEIHLSFEALEHHVLNTVIQSTSTVSTDTDRTRPQNFLLTTAKAFDFKVIQYNISSGLAEHETGTNISPSSVLANETTGQYAVDRQYGIGLIYGYKREFELLLAFNSEVDPDSFTESLLLSVIGFQKNTSLGLSRTFLRLLDYEVDHPPTQSATNGTKMKIRFETSDHPIK